MEGMSPEHEYARVEWERRFLLARFPDEAQVTQTRRIVDHYLDGTRLRLRHIADREGNEVFKLTQKIPEQTAGARQGFITTFYLSKAEFEALATLSAKSMSKLRHSVPPFGIDVFEGALSGLVLAEAEFDSEEDAASLKLPSFFAAEVTTDLRFTGGRLAATTRDDLRSWLAGFGIELTSGSRQC